MQLLNHNYYTLKVLFISSNDHISWGGSEDLWVKLASQFLKSGNQIAIYTSWNPLPNKLIDLFSFGDVKIIRKKKYNYSFLTRIVRKTLPSYYNTSLNKILKWEPDFSIISQGNNFDGLSYIMDLKKNNIPYFTISQAVYEGIWPTYEVSKKMKFIFESAIYNYFVSKDNLEVTKLMSISELKNSKVIKNTFNVPYDNDLLFSPSEKLKLACVARYEFYAKGQDIITDVMSMDKWRNRNIEINFYGAGINKENLIELIKLRGLTNCIVHDHTPTIDIWENNHALILASRFEGLPLAIVEAMLCARTVIVSDVSGNSELIQNGVNGFLFEASRSKYLDNTLELVWSKKHELDKFGEIAREYIKTQVPCNPEEVLYNDIIEKLEIGGLIK